MSRKAVSHLLALVKELQGLNPLHVAEGCQPRFTVKELMEECLNPLHVAEGCQPARSAALRPDGPVSIRCMSRKGVSRAHPVQRAVPDVSIRCMSRKGVSLELRPFIEAVKCLNPLHVAEGCQP